MKQRSKVIATSIATIAMCASLAVGGTFALFTSESEVNIAVTSGTVDVKATATNLDKSNLYSQEAAIDGGMVSISNMLPGDSITFDVEIKNYSTVTANYRTILTSEDGGLADALTVSFDKATTQEPISFLGGYGVDNWKQIAAAQEGGEIVETITVTIAFNTQGNDIDNLYQGKSCAYKVYVEAVQGNAPMVDPIKKDLEETDKHSDTYYIYSEEGMRLMTGIADSQLASMPSEFYLNFKLMADLDMTGYTYYPTRRYFVKFDGNGHTIENLTAVHNPNDEAKKAGLFGYSVSVKNVTLKNVNVTGNQAALVVSSPDGNTISNITIAGNNSVSWVDSGKGWMDGAIGAVVGVAYNTKLTDITLADNATITLNYNGFVNQLDYADDELGGHFYVLETPTVLTNITLGNNAKIVKNGLWYKHIADGVGLDQNGVYHIFNENGLMYFSDKVLGTNNGSNDVNTIIKLEADLNMQNKEFKAMIAQRTDTLTFDGNGYTISNVNVVSGDNDNTTGSAALFYCYPNSTLIVKNLTVDGATVQAIANGTGYAAVIVGYSEAATVLTNVDVKNSTVNGQKNAGILVGLAAATGTLTIDGCDVGENCKVDVTEDRAAAYVGRAVCATTITNCTVADDFVSSATEGWANKYIGQRYSTCPTCTIDGVEYVDTTESLALALSSSEKEIKILLGNANVAWDTADAIGSEGANVTIVGQDAKTSKFTATGAGIAAIRVAGGTLTFKNVEIIDETKSYDEDEWEYGYLELGAGEKDTLVFENCEFNKAIQVCGKATVTFKNCKFNSNVASEYAAWVCSGNATFKDCYFTGPRGLKMHEAYGSEIVSVTVENCTFENITKKPGIAMGTLNAATSVTIKNSKFINCQAGEQNLYIYETDTDVATFKFVNENNTVTNA